MTKKRSIDPAMIDSVAQNMFHVMPLIKKRLLHMDLVQKEHGDAVVPCSGSGHVGRTWERCPFRDFPPSWHRQAQYHAAGGPPL